MKTMSQNSTTPTDESNRSTETKRTDETTRETHLDNLKWLDEWLDEQGLCASAESVRWATGELNK